MDPPTLPHLNSDVSTDPFHEDMEGVKIMNQKR